MNDLCSIELLQNAVSRGLSAEEEATLHAHLEHCESCCAQMEQLAGGEAWQQEAAALLSADELDAAVPEPANWSEVDFSVEHLDPSDDVNVLGQLGGYDVLAIVGRGGMGVVLKAFDHELKRLVAIKALAPHLAHSSVARKRFAREAQAAAAVVNPHVIAIHHVQPTGRLPFLIMPLLTGESLAQRLKARGPLELTEVLRIGMQAATGLAAAHDQGLVHRDVKPANIFLEKGVERVVITDFGLARAADDVSMTRMGVVAGTPEYMSPEQARGEALDGRSDLFSLGCVLYEMATGLSPFRTDSTMATLRRIVEEKPAAMASLVPELPRWFSHIVERLLSKDPAQRFASASEVSQLLEQCLSHLQQPTSVPLPAPLVTHAAGRRSIFNVPRKGVIAMLGTIGMTLLGMVLWQATEAPDISGQWTSEEWGTVVLEAKGPGQYEGAFTGSGKDNPAPRNDPPGGGPGSGPGVPGASAGLPGAPDAPKQVKEPLKPAAPAPDAPETETPEGADPAATFDPPGGGPGSGPGLPGASAGLPGAPDAPKQVKEILKPAALDPAPDAPKTETPMGADPAAPFRYKLAELDEKIAALNAERVKLSETLSPTHPNIRKLDPEVEALEEARASLVATNRQANAGANIVKLPDAEYAKDGFPLDELAGKGVMWNGEESGLSLGYRIKGDEWRILGKEVKVELWVRNAGKEDVKFQILSRPDEGLRVKLTGKDGEEHFARMVPNDVPLFGWKHLLSAGQCIKVNEFSIGLLPPEQNARIGNELRFFVPPGWYQFVCEVKVPGFTATNGDRKQITPGAGEWTGTIRTRSLNVEVIAHDPPAPGARPVPAAGPDADAVSSGGPVDTPKGSGVSPKSGSKVDLAGVLDKTKLGTLHLKWSRVERRFNGTWGKGADRSGTISLRLVDKDIRGGFTTDEEVQLETGTPLVGDLLWKRSSDNPAKNPEPSVEKSLRGKIRRSDSERKLALINLGTEDGVTLGMKFEVRQNAAEYAEGRSPTKGSVEVIRIIDQHMSEVRILKEDLRDKFTEDDDVFSFVIDPKSLAAAAKRFNSETAEVRSQLFVPPIPDLTVERLREGFRQSAIYYRGLGKRQVADALTRSEPSSIGEKYSLRAVRCARCLYWRCCVRFDFTYASGHAGARARHASG